MALPGKLENSPASTDVETPTFPICSACRVVACFQIPAMNNQQRALVEQSGKGRTYIVERPIDNCGFGSTNPIQASNYEHSADSRLQPGQRERLPQIDPFKPHTSGR